MPAGARELDPSRSARDLYGVELRRQRQLAGMSLDRLSEVVNYSKTHLHGVEAAERLPLPPLSEKLDAAFGTGGLFTGLWEIIQRERFAGRYRRFMQLEARATEIRDSAPQVVPGLLQTHAYARALLRIGRPEATSEEVDTWTANRISRQERLRGDEPPYYSALVDEAVLRRPIGGPGVMREQLAALLPFVDSPYSTLQVVPFSHGEHALLGGALILLTLPDDSAIAYREGIGEGEIEEDRETVKRRMRQYDRLRSYALSPRESAALIAAAMEDFTPCEAPPN